MNQGLVRIHRGGLSDRLVSRYALSLGIRHLVVNQQAGKPGFDESQMGRALWVCKTVFIGMFAFEALIKIIAMGFILSPGSYLRQGRSHETQEVMQSPFSMSILICARLHALLTGWNQLELIVVVLGILSVTLRIVDLTFIRGLSLIRFMGRVPAMQVSG